MVETMQTQSAQEYYVSLGTGADSGIKLWHLIHKVLPKRKIIDANLHSIEFKQLYYQAIYSLTEQLEMDIEENNITDQNTTFIFGGRSSDLMEVIFEHIALSSQNETLIQLISQRIRLTPEENYELSLSILNHPLPKRLRNVTTENVFIFDDHGTNWTKATDSIKNLSNKLRIEPRYYMLTTEEDKPAQKTKFSKHGSIFAASKNKVLYQTISEIGKLIAERDSIVKTEVIQRKDPIKSPRVNFDNLHPIHQALLQKTRSDLRFLKALF